MLQCQCSSISIISFDKLRKKKARNREKYAMNLNTYHESISEFFHNGEELFEHVDNGEILRSKHLLIEYSFGRE